MNKLKEWIKDHQVAAFFIVTFIISWGLGFTWGAVMKRDQYLWLPLAIVAVCGPGLAGIIISAVTNTRPRQGTRKAFWITFLTAWFVSALVFLANLIFIEQVQLAPVMLGPIIIAILPVAFVIPSAYSWIPSVRNYLASLTRPQGVWPWVIMALLFIPALVILSFPLNSLLRGESEPLAHFPKFNFTLIGLVIVKFFYQLFFFNATGEEAGWRGFALPRLQARTSPLMAALIISIFWVPWHFFLWQAEGQPVSTLEFWGWMYMGHFLFSVLIVWLCNRGKGSILVAGIAHAASNTTVAFLGPRYLPDLYIIWAIAALVLILVDRMWKKLPSDHPVVYTFPKPTAQPSVQPSPSE